MEAYAVDELVASADAVLAGLGAPLGMLAEVAVRLAGEELAGASLEVIEGEVARAGREAMRLLVQLALDVRAAGERRRDDIAGPDGVARRWVEEGRERGMTSAFGPVVVARMAYRAAGKPALHPVDAVLSLPPRRYSWPVQREVVELAQSGAYEQARGRLAAAGVKAGKLQLEQIVAEAARDADEFYGQPPARPPGSAGPEPAGAGVPLVLSVDGKGVAMRPEARRRRYGKAAQRSKSFGKRLGTGEKNGVKRMAEVGVVFDAIAPDDPRTPELIMGCAPAGPDGARPRAGQVRAERRWYAADLAAGQDVTIGRVFAEATRRDPRHERTWVVLVDGNPHQIAAIQAEAATCGAEVTIVVDLIHVLEYLWKAAWAFHPPRDPAAEAWVVAQATDVLHGHAAAVAARISQLTPLPGAEHQRNARAAISYLTNKQPYLDYPTALASGWPIATSIIEGACRHLVADRMGITGARWGLEGAEAILKLRAIKANGDIDAYWAYHIKQEHHRNHTSRYQDGLALTA